MCKWSWSGLGQSPTPGGTPRASCTSSPLAFLRLRRPNRAKTLLWGPKNVPSRGTPDCRPQEGSGGGGAAAWRPRGYYTPPSLPRASLQQAYTRPRQDNAKAMPCCPCCCSYCTSLAMAWCTTLPPPAASTPAGAATSGCTSSPAPVTRYAQAELGAAGDLPMRTKRWPAHTGGRRAGGQGGRRVGRRSSWAGAQHQNVQSQAGRPGQGWCQHTLAASHWTDWPASPAWPRA